MSLADSARPFVIGSLGAYGFSIEQSNSSCGLFIDRIQKFINAFCSYYDEAVEDQLKNANTQANKSNLSSWAYKEIAHILNAALAQYSSLISEKESILLQTQKIKCEIALMYFHKFIDFVETSKQNRLVEMQLIPSSPKFQKKKRDQDWTPYPINVAFDKLMRLFGSAA